MMEYCMGIGTLHSGVVFHTAPDSAPWVEGRMGGDSGEDEGVSVEGA